MANEEEPGNPPVASSRRDLMVTIGMMAAAAVAIGGFGLLFSMWWQAEISDKYEILRIASQEYIAGREIVAGELAAGVTFEEEAETDEESEADPEPLSEAEQAALEERQKWIRLRDFLVGAGKAARAQSSEERRDRRRLYQEAIPHLQKVRDAGFPPGRESEGNRLLGLTLFEVGRYEESARAFEAAIAGDPTLERELLPTLARAQLDSAKPASADALAIMDRFLRNGNLPEESRREGVLLRIRALIDLKRWPAAEEALRAADLVEPSSELQQQIQEAEFRDQLKLLGAILRIQQAIDQFGPRPTDEYQDRSAASEFLESPLRALVEVEREAFPKAAAQSRIWSARGLLVLGDVEGALNHLTIVRQARPFEAEAVVGGLEEIELLAEQGRGIEMLQTTRYVMRELSDETGYDASLMPFDEFKRRMRGAIDSLRQRGEFRHAIDAARSLPPVFPRSDALLQEALGFREWAASTLADGTDISGQVARSASILARSRYRAAGDAFAEAAQLEFNTPQFIPTQWLAIEAYQDGRHFSRSIALLEPYLRYEERRRLPRGLIAQGRALLAVGKPEKAIDALTTCIVEFPRDPLQYDARLLAALAHADLGNLDGAKTLLTENLQDGALTPQNQIWQDSLFTLGELLYQRGHRNFLVAQRQAPEERLKLLGENQPVLREAVRRLDEAVQRYWPLPRAEEAAYLSARAHVLASHWPRLEAESPDVLDAARRALRAQTDQELQTALEGFAYLKQHMIRREEEHRLPEKEQAMLRNCYLAEADTLREMKRWEEAATAYRTVSLRFMNEPPALEAILGQARCAKDLGRVRESELLIRQAAVVLSRIPNEWNGRFEETTRLDRDGWTRLLTWMNNRIPAGTGV